MIEEKRRISAVAADEFIADKKNWRTLPSRLERLVGVLQEWQDNSEENTFAPGIPLASFSNDLKEAKRIAMTAAVLASADMSNDTYSSIDLVNSFQALFRASLESRQPPPKNKDNDNDNDMGITEYEMNESQEEEEEEEGEQDALFAHGAEQVLFDNLRVLGWIRIDGFLMPALGAAIHRVILSKVRTTIVGDFEEDSFFPAIEAWCQSTVEVWVKELVGENNFEVENWTSRLQQCAAHCFCLVRIEEIFDIVCEFPDSRPAVSEIQIIMEKTKMHSELGDALRNSLVRRLNHPGANTSQIIDCYINTIKVLREIDPSDRLLEVVTEPVRSYLRARNDTVRCIITRYVRVDVEPES
jgi:anaphase-promoting complex subunit 2